MSEKKKLLMLGGSDIQISAIESAKEMGYYVITADYLPDNPGHKFSDEYHDVSTTDKEAIFTLAKRCKVDGISSYASDPGALTQAYVSEKLNLETNSYSSVSILSDKITFRAAQEEAKIPFPKFKHIQSPAEGKQFIEETGNKCIIKPVDCSGSKGVHIWDFDDDISGLIEDSLSFSRVKKIIIEEFVPRVGFLMSGDVLVENGKIIFFCFGDVHFNDSINGLVPRSISLPASKPISFFKKLIVDIEKLFSHLEISTGAFNIDVIETTRGNQPMIIDIGARNGGNMLNNIIHFHTGYDLIKASIQQCMGDPITVTNTNTLNGFYSHYVLHSEVDGKFKSIEFSDFLKERLLYSKVNLKKGDSIKRFVNSGCRLGLLLVKYDSFEQMHELLSSNFKDHITINLL